MISSIIDLLQQGGGTVDELVAKLVKRLPDREPTVMKTTINIQIGGRLGRERGLKIKTMGEGKEMRCSI